MSNEEIELLLKSLEETKSEYEGIRAAERELLKQLEAVRHSRNIVEDKARQQKRDLKQAEREWEQEQYRQELARKAEEQQKALALKAESFDEITGESKWRDRAYDHQLSGAHFLAAAGSAVCADAMGLGKTLQIIMTLEMLQSKKTLVICPGEVASVFEREILNWGSRPPLNLARKDKGYQQVMLETVLPTMPSGAYVIVNFETWFRNSNVIKWLQLVGFDSVVIDEAHRIKELDKLPYRGSKEIILAHNQCPYCDTITVEQGNWCPTHGINDPVPSIKNAFCMTGTLILNRPSEAFAPLSLVQPEIFSSRRVFNEEYTTVGYDNKERWAYKGETKLAEQIKGFYLRRTLSDAGITLPPQEIITHELEITPDEYPLQYKILDMIRNEAQIQIEDEYGDKDTVPLMGILPWIMRLRQATSWPGGITLRKKLFDELGNPIINELTGEQAVQIIPVGLDYRESIKIDKVVELYEELVSSGHRVAVFSQFKEVLKEIERRLGPDVVRFDGDTPTNKRDEIKNNFDASVGETPKWKGILCHYETGGVGLTLTGATAMIIPDKEWNDGKQQQAYDRIHRIGQENNTQIHILKHIGPGYSIDTWLDKLIEQKRDIVSGFTMSMQEVKELFQ